MNDLTKDFWDWVDNRAVISRVVLFVTLWMTYKTFDWAAGYATSHPTTPGSDVAMIIAAVTAPISILQGYVFKAYIGYRTAQE